MALFFVALAIALWAMGMATGMTETQFILLIALIVSAMALIDVAIRGRRHRG